MLRWALPVSVNRGKSWGAGRQREAVWLTRPVRGPRGDLPRRAMGNGVWRRLGHGRGPGGVSAAQLPRSQICRHWEGLRTRCTLFALIPHQRSCDLRFSRPNRSARLTKQCDFILLRSFWTDLAGWYQMCRHGEESLHLCRQKLGSDWLQPQRGCWSYLWIEK